MLSAVVAADLGWWVLGIGLARYVFGALFALVAAAADAARPGPGSGARRSRCWSAIVLAVAAVLPLPDLVATVAVAVVAVLLAESFVHEAVDRWRAPRRAAGRCPTAPCSPSSSSGSRSWPRPTATT